MAEWLRRWTANPLCSARVGSNPILVEFFFFFFSLLSILPSFAIVCRAYMYVHCVLLLLKFQKNFFYFFFFGEVIMSHFDSSSTLEFVAGEVIYSLIGFTNDASIDFVVTAIEASFR